MLHVQRVRVIGIVALVALVAAVPPAGGVPAVAGPHAAVVAAAGGGSQKLDRALVDRLATLTSSERVRIAIWCATVDRSGIEQVQARVREGELERADLVAAVSERVAQANAPVVAVLAARGVQPRYVSTCAPLVYAEVDRAAIDALARMPEVSRLYVEGRDEPCIEHASKTDRADVVWARGITGSGTTDVAIVEVPFAGSNASRMDRPHDWLAGANDATTTFQPGNPASDHATAVAGRVAAVRQSGTPDHWRGVAPDLPAMLSANASSGNWADVNAAWDWAIQNNADILNYSAADPNDFSGTPSVVARYIDYIVRTHLVTVTTTCGNEGANPAHVVQNPGLSYNSITVGAYEDNDDNEWIDFPDDSMLDMSSWRNPPGTDRELPEVVAVGGTIESTLTGNTVGDIGSGTSFAAPGVAGIAALLIQRQGALLVEPQALKAIVMAGACHNIEGDTRLSDKDGAGAVVACEADEIARDGRYSYRTMVSSDFAGGIPGGTWNYNSMNLARELTARVVTCWLTPVEDAPDYNYPANAPVNLDMRVYDPGGALVASSLSSDNNYEIVEFKPTTTGVHRVEIMAMSWVTGQVVPWGIAWTQEPCCSPDWGDAPDDMMHCTPPDKGDFPTKASSDGARAREFEIEWLSEDNPTMPGATWELDAETHPFAGEKDQDGISNIISAPCQSNNDAEDDGVKFTFDRKEGRVEFWVNSATPNIGRYSDTEFQEQIYVNAWFDWNTNGQWDWSERLIHWWGGPGLVGQCDAFGWTCVAGCDLWPAGTYQKRVEFKFDIPQPFPEDPVWARFRLDYGEDIQMPEGESSYGEIEDHWLEGLAGLEFDQFYNSLAKFDINVFGRLTETIRLSGPVLVIVDLDSLGDADENGLEEVTTEMVEMELTGDSQYWGPVTVRVRPETEDPYLRSCGVIEELVNTTPGVLDIPPFAPSGQASSWFDVYFEIDVARQTFYNRDPKGMTSTIRRKPPDRGDGYRDPYVIELYTGGVPALISIADSEHEPNPPVPDPHGQGYPMHTSSIGFGVGTTPSIPADFFGPGSDPFDGVIYVRGEALNPFQTGDSSSLFQRWSLPVLPEDPIGAMGTVDLQFLELSLVSVDPIVVTYNGGQDPMLWNVHVGLSNVQKFVEAGELSATKTHENGGTFDTVLMVQPKLTFTNVEDPMDMRVLDTGLAGYDPITLMSSGTPFVHSKSPALDIVAPNDGYFVPMVEETVPGDPYSQVVVDMQAMNPAAPAEHWMRPATTEGFCVDNDAFIEFEGCMTGPELEPEFGCGPWDADESDDVDLLDFAYVQQVPCEPDLTWIESFDTYPTGSGLAGQGGWETWDNDPGFDAQVSGLMPLSPPNSVDIVGGSDVVRQFTGHTSGAWRFATWCYVPADYQSGGELPYRGSSLILLNRYEHGGPYHWSVQLRADSDTGAFVRDGVVPASTPLVTERWVPVEVLIDLDSDLYTVLYDGIELGTAESWTAGVQGGGGGQLNIAALDLFANSSTSVYWDNFSLFEEIKRGPKQEPGRDLASIMVARMASALAW